MGASTDAMKFRPDILVKLGAETARRGTRANPEAQISATAAIADPLTDPSRSV